MRYLGQDETTATGDPWDVWNPPIAPPRPPEEECNVYDDDSCYQTPPYVPPLENGKPPYALPVEVFERTVPIPVSRPEPVPFPIPTELEYPEFPPAAASNAGLLIGGAVVLGLLALGMGAAKRKRKKG